MNIYVGNLNYKVDEENLTEVFGEFGDVESVKIIQDKVSGRSKGFAFIEMPNDEDALKAIDQLHQSDFLDRKMVVNQAKPRD